MALAISLWFDEASEKKIREIWQDFHAESIAAQLHEGNYRPHINLSHL